MDPKEPRAEHAQHDRWAEVKDLAYGAVGLGVMTFQRAMVRRRELEKRCSSHRLDDVVETFGDRAATARRIIFG